jgi:hypothetical protein
MKLVLILTVGFVVAAFVLRAVIPDRYYVPGGWPWGSHWYHANWFVFWFCLLVGGAIGLLLVIKLATRGQIAR